ncbi:MAG: hypothetical protein BGO07_00265 [Alphaproteobacteria bacterium 40-19]|mgnify:CR=1 FL=1|nr:MAG: hypothetical protein BGO07_00265 [Alphaproteobacteria bacterium 40-19]
MAVKALLKHIKPLFWHICEALLGNDTKTFHFLRLKEYILTLEVLLKRQVILCRQVLIFYCGTGFQTATWQGPQTLSCACTQKHIDKRRLTLLHL